MIVRELITLLGFEVDAQSEKRAKGSFEGLKKIAGTLAAVFVTGKLAQGFRKAITLAGDAVEVTDLLGDTFGDLTDDVVAFSDSFAEETGRSRFELREMTADTGALAKGLLGSQEAAAELSQRMVMLAVDLSSARNVPLAETLASLKSGIVGQSEPLQKFGVAMTIAALEQFRLEQGIKKSVRQMTEQEKVLLRLSFIQAKTNDVVGNAAKTARSFSNQARTLSGGIRDLFTDIGLELLPTVEAFQRTLISIVNTIKGPLISVFRVVGRVMNAFSAPLPQMVAGLSAIVLALKLLGLQSIQTWLVTLGPMLPIIVLLGLIGAAIFLVIEDLQQLGEGGESVIGGLIGEFQFLLEQTGSIFGAIGGLLKTAVEFWASLLLGIPISEVREEFQKFGDFFEGFKTDLAEFASEVLPALLDPFGLIRFNVAAVQGAASLLGGGNVRPAAGGSSTTTSNAAAATVEITVDARGNPQAGELSESIGMAAQKGTERGLRLTLNQLTVGSGG